MSSSFIPIKTPTLPSTSKGHWYEISAGAKNGARSVYLGADEKAVIPSCDSTMSFNTLLSVY